MRFVSFLHDGAVRPGILDGDAVRVLANETLAGYIASSRAERDRAQTRETLPLSRVRLVAPVRPCKNVFCVGRNYLDHALEIARARGSDLRLPSVPTFFTKAPTAIAGPDETLELSADISSEYDWEAELAVIIGERCRDVAASSALDAVFGYACFNDLTARDLQRAHQQWFKGKSLDHSAPIGPWIVDAADVGDPQNLDIGLRLNGVSKQQSNTSRMIFDVARIIASLSRGLTLEPGDVIATGTPDGVGMARTPPEFLHDGDVMEVEIERIGVLRNAVAIRAETRAP
jgi:2-keto-4-pentenoate hydratase/2-oxohepta-3-ene-1,7-dioic acid hydratase in catechol pathway